METKQTQNQITEGVIWRQLLRFFFPILLGTLFQQLYTTVDAVIVGNYVGKEALAAVGGSTSLLINLLIGFFLGLASGGSVIVAQFYGAKNEDATSRAVHTMLCLGLIAAVLFTLAGLTLARPALVLLGVPETILPDALSYMRIYFSGIVFPILYNIGSSILRAVGDSRRPLYILIVCCVVNVLLDLLFVVALRMEVNGVAVATLLSQAISVVLTFACLFRSRDCYRASLRLLRVDGRLLERTLRIGLPIGIQSTLYSVSNLLAQRTINAFGTDTMAAWTAFGKVDSFFWMMLGSLGVAVTTFAGQNYGAGKFRRVHQCNRTGIWMGLAGGVAMSVLVMLARGPMLRLFTDDGEVIRLAALMMCYTVPFYCLFVPIEILSATIKAAGQALIPMLITLMGICALRVVWILGVVPRWHSLGVLCVSYPISWLVTSAILMVYYLRGNWMQQTE